MPEMSTDCFILKDVCNLILLWYHTLYKLSRCHDTFPAVRSTFTSYKFVLVQELGANVHLYLYSYYVATRFKPQTLQHVSLYPESLNRRCFSLFKTVHTKPYCTVQSRYCTVQSRYCTVQSLVHAVRYRMRRSRLRLAAASQPSPQKEGHGKIPNYGIVGLSFMTMSGEAGRTFVVFGGGRDNLPRVFHVGA
ncbi:uncharacterized protein YALI1_A12294g [Yarrowia lipolytica]|uniref:Uncharacterized protein n=1 Tax=Yarrowia lipolytica TaxID=4952 RepID=A0A1D8N4I8_YARLL|nr:hypothetical protein YALI1_A12294g [Yarrowia lipolytica]